MRRRLFLLSLCLLVAGSLFGANNGRLDDKIKDKLSKGKKSERIRVIVQRFTPASAGDLNDIRAKGGKVSREIRRLHTIVAEMTLDQIEKMSAYPHVKRISIDEPVEAHAAEPGVVSGAALATQTYGVT